MATDSFSSNSSGLESPAVDVFPITPNDSADLSFVTRAIRAQTAGTVACVMVNGQTRNLQFLAGETRAVRVARVLSTGTTASMGLEGMV
jgi:hypothetical protein